MFKKNIKLLIFTVANALLLSFSGLASAEGTQPGSVSPIPNPLGAGNDTFPKFITLLLDTVFPIASIVSVFFIIYAGFRMVISAGNEEKLTSAKTALIWSMIGIGILLGAKVLSAVICGTINQLGTPKLSC